MDENSGSPGRSDAEIIKIHRRIRQGIADLNKQITKAYRTLEALNRRSVRLDKELQQLMQKFERTKTYRGMKGYGEVTLPTDVKDALEKKMRRHKKIARRICTVNESLSSLKERIGELKLREAQLRENFECCNDPDLNDAVEEVKKEIKQLRV